jgi:PAS domain-containing protein
LPSLILRLEQLAQPGAAPASDSPSEPDPQDAPAGPAATATVAPPEDTRTAVHGIGTARRIVDIAGQERQSTATSLSRWSAAVAASHDACFVIDVSCAVVSVSLACVDLLGFGDAAIIGQSILDVLNLVDLESGAPQPEYAARIPPLVVLDGPGLARSIIRIRHEDDAIVTLDTSSAPIHDASGQLVGSITFLSPIPAR